VTDLFDREGVPDVTVLARDDALLDALGRGEPAPADDEVAGLLAAWRSELDPPTERTTVRTAVPLAIPPFTAPAIERATRRWRPGRMLVAAAAALVGLAGGLTVAAGSAGPDSPLWPITRVVYPERAESRLAQAQAESAIERARTAVQESRYADADRLLREATTLTGQIQDEGVVRRLLDEIDAVRHLLPGLAPDGSVPGGPSGGQPPAPGQTAGSGGGPTPTAAPGGGLPLPSVPVPPVPSLPVPTLPLPSLPVPTLPLPTLPGIG